MSIALALVLIVVGVVFAANTFGSLTGRYSGPRRVPGQMATWVNVVFAAAVAALAFAGAVVLLTE